MQSKNYIRAELILSDTVSTKTEHYISTTEVLSIALLLCGNALHCQVSLFQPNPEYISEL